MIVPAVYVHCGFGLLLTVFSVPLVLRRIPMNRAYGIRLPEAFSSDARWYDINAYGGRLFLGYGLLLSFFGFLARHDAPPPASLWSPVFFVLPLLLALLLLSPSGRTHAVAFRKVREASRHSPYGLHRGAIQSCGALK